MASTATLAAVTEHDAPRVSGELDAGYVRAALLRAGLDPPAADDVELRRLTGGRTGAAVTAIDAPPHRLVHKVAPAGGWRVDGMQRARQGEAALWLAGATRTLPRGIECPTLDVAVRDDGSHWILMRDVSDGITPRGAFGEPECRATLAAVARLHARYWGREDELAALPLPDARGTTRVWAQPLVHVARGGDAPGWVAAMIEDVVIVSRFVPTLLEVLGPSDADFLVDLASQCDEWAAHLDAPPTTLNHGDLRRANIAFEGDVVTLIDWEFAARAHAACDLQWHFFLELVAYPPDDGKGLDDRAGLVDHYLERLEAELGRPVDRAAFARALDLAWLRVLVQLGFCLVDPLIGDHDADDEAKVRARCRWSIERARRAAERWL